jgi:ribulose-bisphosphate carboxylase large chain
MSYYYATYYIKSKTTLGEATNALAVGQSIGNPSIRSEFETEELIKNHSAVVWPFLSPQETSNSGVTTISFPLANLDFETDGLTQILVQTMGGQCDIDIIKECHLLDLNFPDVIKWPGPKYGLSGMREYCGIYNKPLLGGITKPKVGLSPEKHLELVKLMVDGGCNFIKEDEILSGAKHCDLEKRVDLVMNYIHKNNYKVFYCASISSDYPHLLARANKVAQLGGNGIHFNFHCGLGSYRSIRLHDLPLLLHFQKSGDKIFTSQYSRYRIREKLLYKLMSLSGCDTLHCGMLGGYMDSDEKETKRIVNMLVKMNSVPALSCGMHPGLIDNICEILGHCDWMANVGGALSGHPMGTLAGVKAMRQAIDKNYGPEYECAIQKWGKK